MKSRGTTQVESTNDAATVSKRSAERAGYPFGPDPAFRQLEVTGDVARDGEEERKKNEGSEEEPRVGGTGGDRERGSRPRQIPKEEQFFRHFVSKPHTRAP